MRARVFFLRRRRWAAWSAMLLIGGFVAFALAGLSPTDLPHGLSLMGIALTLGNLAPLLEWAPRARTRQLAVEAGRVLGAGRPIHAENVTGISVARGREGTSVLVCEERGGVLLDVESDAEAYGIVSALDAGDTKPRELALVLPRESLRNVQAILALFGAAMGASYAIGADDVSWGRGVFGIGALVAGAAGYLLFIVRPLFARARQISKHDDSTAEWAAKRRRDPRIARIATHMQDGARDAPGSYSHVPGDPRLQALARRTGERIADWVARLDALAGQAGESHYRDAGVPPQALLQAAAADDGMDPSIREGAARILSTRFGVDRSVLTRAVGTDLAARIRVLTNGTPVEVEEQLAEIGPLYLPPRRV